MPCHYKNPPGDGSFCEAATGQGSSWKGARPHCWTDDEARGGNLHHHYHLHHHHDHHDHHHGRWSKPSPRRSSSGSGQTGSLCSTTTRGFSSIMKRTSNHDDDSYFDNVWTCMIDLQIPPPLNASNYKVCPHLPQHGERLLWRLEGYCQEQVTATKLSPKYSILMSSKSYPFQPLLEQIFPSARVRTSTRSV